MNKENVITLDNPVKRGEQVIEQVTLMKPNAGTLRGVSLAAVANSEVDALIKVLPRMTAPMLTEQEVAALELPDLVALVPVRWSVFCRRTRCSDVPEKFLGR
ncbi:Phage tail protein E [Escherichia coli]|nr:Phage tail protein E [Escherichia coli]